MEFMKKIGVVSVYTKLYYGTVLQAYATQVMIDKMGYKNETINVSKGEMNKALEYKLDAPEKFTLIYNGILEIDLPDKEELKGENGLKKNVKYV